MEWIKIVLWFFAGSFLGKFVVSTFAMQIRIIKNCTRKIIDRIRNDHDFWDSAACEKYLNSVIWKNRIILVVITFLVLQFAPLIAAIGYAISALIWWIISGPSAGLNSNNIEDSIKIILRYSKPGMEEEMSDGLSWITQQMMLEAILKK